MEFKNLTKNTTISNDNIRKGRILTKTLNEELDSSTIVLTQISTLNIEPYDLIKFTNEFDGVEYWLVADASFMIVNYQSGLRDYTINMMSITKLLEGVQLPNMAITNIGQNKKISHYLRNIITYFNEFYGSEIFYTNTITSSNYEIEVSNELIQKTQNTVCPECVFTQPTLREYIDYLLQFIGCIADLSFNGTKFYLNYKDLNYRSGTINTAYLDKIEGSISANDYVTILDHTIDNIVGNVLTEIVEVTSNDYIVNSNNACIKLSHNIYDIINVYADVNNNDFGFSGRCCIVDLDYTDINYSIKDKDAYLNVGNYNTDIDDTLTTANISLDISNVDISRYVVPQSVYTSYRLSVANDLADIIQNDINCVNNSMYYSRGSNTINGLYNFQSKQFLWYTYNSATSFEMAVVGAWLRERINDASSYRGNTYKGFLNNDGSLYSYEIDNNTALLGVVTKNNKRYAIFTKLSNVTAISGGLNTNFKYMFKIIYRPYVNVRLSLEQIDTHTHKISMQDNSANAQTDISKFMDASVEKNKQLGNDALVMQATSPSESLIYLIGQQYNNYVLNKVEYSIKNNSIAYKGILTKNYSNRNINNVLNREKRYYSLADTSESVLRSEYAIVTRSSTATPTHMYFSCSGCETGSGYFEGIIPCTVVSNDDYIAYTGIMMDNIMFSKYTDLSNNVLGGYRIVENTYCDTYGESTLFEVKFGYFNDNFDFNKYLKYGGKCYNETNESLSDSDLNVVASYTFDVSKDNREQMSFTLICRKN